MICREDRDRLIQVLDSYLDERMWAFELDEQLSELGRRTNDETVRDLTIELWFTYDDLVDHKMVADKALWDFFQRVILLLRSEAEIVHGPRVWTWREFVAGAALLIFLAACGSGWSWRLLWITPPLGLLSGWLRYTEPPERDGAGLHFRYVHPFGSLSDLSSARRQIPDFMKREYPALRSRRVTRGRLSERAMMIPSLLGYVLFSPLFLLTQAIGHRPYRVQYASEMLPRSPESRQT